MSAKALSGLRKALLASISSSPLALSYGADNSPFDKPVGATPWAAVFIMTNQPSVATMGYDGQDAHDGILQIDLNYPLLTGEAAVSAKADELHDFYKAGKRFASADAEVTIASCGRSRGREVDGWYRVSMTISWFARVARN